MNAFIISCFVVLAWAPGLYSGQTQPARELWTKINLLPVCFEGQGDRPGHLVYVGPGKLVGALKLVYKSGSIRCGANTAYDSRWGCYQVNGMTQFPLNVVITDEHRNVIFPLPKNLATNGFKSGLWYYLPMTDSGHSDELVFTNYLDPFYLPKYQKLMVWYGEDLTNWYEGDDVGRVCVDVYAHML
ncbi:uncharacterized protein LOC116621207 [Nematostella vectensis]|uniref:uncharacterized protein LOC116621207 n=1 Tax=Nematostella vectensis TaxID=45351 RepID=UPI00207770EA|nr:uncharacterized protein LOC116621207 [Nematostella vectensis]